MKKMTSYILGAALASASLVAGAQEPMQLTEGQMDGVTAGANWNNSVRFFGGELILSGKLAKYRINTMVRGNSATADASADALGWDTDAETWTATSVVQGRGSASVSKSISLTDGAYHCWPCWP